MSIKNFLTSKTFFIQLAIAFAVIVISAFLFMHFLSFKTNHGEEMTVPDLSKMQFSIAEEKLAEMGLDIVLLDTVDFKDDLPPYSIVEQDPKTGSMVKDGRKIYVKLNAGEYNEVTLPEFKDKTYRQIIANLNSLGLKEGTKTYKPHIAKDVVLQITSKGKNLKKGDKIKKNTVIDFVLGDGKELYDGNNLNSSSDVDSEEINIEDGE
ncbi:PASTA domain-containing protein [Flavobacterium sp.]|jgi:beta-lactam-binding protein with PASTA domain|uniref:PASTA domain-containing protein n=1 Tax=Flavobacterium sp. TaxID=239 RepID=UPI002A7F3DFD|nr:PASTA domain-containing protein [Flavobacterium sp.]